MPHRSNKYAGKKLRTIETVALKIALGIPSSAMNDAVYAEVQWLRIPEERLYRAARYVIRAQVIPNHPCKKFFQKSETDIDLMANHHNSKYNVRNKGKTVGIYE